LEPVRSLSPSVRRLSGSSAEHFNGNIAEVIVFDNAIVPEDRDAVAAYLGGKWGGALQ
jgi:hypothetical protein